MSLPKVVQKIINNVGYGQTLTGSDNDVVHKSTNETLAGVKTFSSIPNIPTTTPSSDANAASKKYVDTKTDLIYRSSETGDDVAAAHNCIYRGKNLTNVYTIDQLHAKVAAGDFSDLYIGDYITKPVTASATVIPTNNDDQESITVSISGNFNFRIAHFNYWKYMGDSSCTANHIVFVPDKPFMNCKMRKTNTTEGGVKASHVWYLLQNTIYTAVNASTCMNGKIVTHRDYIPANVNNDAYSRIGQGSKGSTYYVSSSSDWTDVKLGLMHEPMVYTASPASSSVRDTGCGKSQLALFRLDPTWINCRSARSSFWLCAVSSSAGFADALGYGDATYYNASASRGVRPYFLFS